MGLGDELSKAVFQANYAQRGETARDVFRRVAGALAENDKHFLRLSRMFEEGKFWPGGRILATMGTMKQATAVSGFASGPVEDNLESIMLRASEAARTMSLGGGIAVDFSRLRPRGGKATGPVSFMQIFDAVGQVITDGGSRRGKVLATLNAQHPDVEEFLLSRYPNVATALALGDGFMQAVVEGRDVPLLFGGKSTVSAKQLWEAVLRSIYDTGGPLLLFIDRINRLNVMNYAETLHTTTLFGEVPLPHYGSCPVGSMNLGAYEAKELSSPEFVSDIQAAVVALDNVIDRTRYPLPQQETVAKATRRIGLGVMGLRKAKIYLNELPELLQNVRTAAHIASVSLGKQKGVFPSYQPAAGVERRNSHLLAISPNKIIGTVSGASPGISQLSPGEAVTALGLATPYVDNGIAMKVPFPRDIPWADFQALALQAWHNGSRSLELVAQE